jgi:DNA-binding NarL/FixJ family response regulator
VNEVRVLIVDDQETYRSAMRAVVEATDGFVVVGEVSTGEASLVATERVAPDLVLMDVNLPGIDGIEAGQRLRGRGDGPVVVLLSTYAEDDFDLDDRTEAAYVTKASFGPDRLVRAWAGGR